MTFGPASAASWTGDDATATNPAVKYSVGGTVSGLSGPCNCKTTRVTT